MKVSVDDLIGAPWELGGRGPGYDCWGVAAVVLSRLGLTPPPIPAGPDRDPVAAVEEFGAGWIKLGERPLDACKVGDVVVTDPSGERASVHLSVVVDESPRRLLTAVEHGGVVRAPRLTESETVGAYRLGSMDARVGGEKC